MMMRSRRRFCAGSKDVAILVVGPEPPPYTGMELATQTLTEELRRRDVLVTRVDTADPADPQGNRARWTGRNIFLALASIVRTAYRLRDRRTAVLYVPIAQTFPALYRDCAILRMGQMARKRTVVHLHGGALRQRYDEMNVIQRAILRSTLRSVDVGIVLSDELRPALEWVMPRARVRVVRNGLSFSVPASGERAGSTVLFFSTLFREKGILVFIEAMNHLRRSQPDVRAVAAGYWPGEDVRIEVMRAVRATRLEDRVTFPGPVETEEHKQRLFAETDVFCFPSQQIEGQPLVVLEAMAAALPVVATKRSGLRDLVLHEQTGLLVDASPEAIASALSRLLDNAELRRRMGAAARARYEELFTTDVFGERIYDVIKPLLLHHGD